MRLKTIVPVGQAVLIFVVLFFLSCSPNSPGRNTGAAAVVPPPTPPLTRPVLGYGVISVSYTHVTAEPSQAGLSLGFFRRGSVVNVIERRSINHGEFAESWVFVEGVYRGWLREDVIRIYDNEARAKTAAESLVQ
ncbi:MAG: hypothetical protein LBB83_12535 [Treponema sp.]|jgi:hypothetical protein|nr:hypothetical protein [Treponema sp.]